jgi:hypothetical protein
MLSLLLWQWLKVERLHFFTMIKCGGMTCSFVWKPFGLASKLLCSNQFNFKHMQMVTCVTSIMPWGASLLLKMACSELIQPKSEKQGWLFWT